MNLPSRLALAQSASTQLQLSRAKQWPPAISRQRPYPYHLVHGRDLLFPSRLPARSGGSLKVIKTMLMRFGDMRERLERAQNLAEPLFP
jgi:hypothetical protein